MAHGVYISPQIHTQNMYCLLLSTAATVTRTRLIVTLYVHSPFCYVAVYRMRLP
jgi:hypothetical protein